MLSRLFNHRTLAVLFLGFSSGLPLVLIGSTLQAWYTVAGINLVTIGALTLVGQPYVYKFLWAPLMDRYIPGPWGRRRSWIFWLQLMIVAALAWMAYLQPTRNAWLLASIALGIAFFSASQDIAIDAYRTDILHRKEKGMGAALYTLGYRLAMLVAGAVALILAQEIGWQWTYIIMAICMAGLMLITLLAPEEPAIPAPTNLRDAIIDPLREFLSRPHVSLIIAFIVLYKLTDAFALALNTPFLIRGLGFNLIAIGLIYKTDSLIALLLGSLIGGWWLVRAKLYDCLWYFGWLQMTSNLAYMALAMVGKSYWLMISAVFLEYFCSGLVSVAFIVFLMNLCDHRYTATQYAIFSALMVIGRVYIGPEAGFLVEKLGWASFYFISFLVGLPALIILAWLKKRISFDGPPSVAVSTMVHEDLV